MNNSDLTKYIESVNKGIDWSSKFQKGQRQQDTTKGLIDMRRKAKRLLFANSNKPSAALYGESQVGKSYLAKNFFSMPKKAFQIKDPSNGNYYNFLEEINPKGGKVEATSVVTRFSLDVNTVDENYPILINLARPLDVALMLIDSRLSELQKTLGYKEISEIKNSIDALAIQYSNSTNTQDVFGMDEVFDIKDYLERYFPISPITTRLEDAGFWQVIPEIVHKIPSNDWYKFLEIIWNENPQFNDLFNKLIGQLVLVNFATQGFCKFDAVLRKNGTLLDVNRLHQINNPENPADATEYVGTVELLYKKDGNTGKGVLDKNLLCALSSEVVFKVEDELKEHTKFVQNIDLLDFPGARERTRIELDAIDKNISDIILRGKVAYLFNRYSSSYLINNLLFCHRSEQLGAKITIPLVLNNWIQDYIGRDSKEREELLSTADVPPLFIIFGWFNEDLKFDSVNDKTDAALEQKWYKRFERIFKNEVQTNSYNWSTEWTLSQKYFQNMYMLRDFIWSSEQGSNIYKGFLEFGEETERIDPPQNLFENYWEKLKTSFINYPLVKNHFKNPEQAWESSATINKDGTIPIIENLYKASDPKIRERKFEREFNTLRSDYTKLLDSFYEDEDSSNQIANAVSKYGELELDLNITFGQDPYFFGKMMKKFHIDEGTVYNFYRDKLNDPEIIDVTDRRPYTVILLKNPGLSTKKENYDSNVELLRKNHGLQNTEKVEEYFKERDIDLNELFFGEATKVLTNSKYLANGLQTYWLEEHLQKLGDSESRKLGLSEVSMENLKDNLIANFKKHKIADQIAKTIRKYVDRYDKIDKVHEMIADMSASIINNFINNMGFELYSEDRLQNLKDTGEKYDLKLDLSFDDLQFNALDENQLVDLFDKTSRLDELLNQTPLDRESLKNIPSFSHYVKWTEQLKLSFINGCDIPTYDVLANQELGKLLNKGEKSTT